MRKIATDDLYFNKAVQVLAVGRTKGNFAFEKSTSSVNVADLASTAGVEESLTAVTVDLLTVGASNVSAFAGINGGTGSALGLQLNAKPILLFFFAS